MLLRTTTPIPRARESLQFLHSRKIPFILLTNGGGKLESDRVDDLSARLGVPLSVDNFIQSHTPFAHLDGLKGDKDRPDEAVLVVGGPNAGADCRRVAER